MTTTNLPVRLEESFYLKRPDFVAGGANPQNYALSTAHKGKTFVCAAVAKLHLTSGWYKRAASKLLQIQGRYRECVFIL